MLEFLPSFASLLSYGSVSPASKKAIGIMGRHRAIVYAYAALILLLLTGVFALGLDFWFPAELLPVYIAQITLGGLGAIAIYKALDHGKASIVAPLAKTYVLLVLATSIIFLGEELSAGQVAGSLLIVASAVVLALGRGGKLRFEGWMVYLGLSVICRTYYYTYIKVFVSALGPYMATFFLELGVAAFVVAFHALRGRDISPPPVAKIGFPATAGLLIFFGSLLYSVSVGLIGAALTAAISAGAPIVNAVAAYFMLGEKLDMQKYAATIMMVVGLVAILLL